MVVAEEARQLLGLGRPAAKHLRPRARDELRVAPVLLDRLAPLVQGLVGGVLVGFAEHAARAAVGAFRARNEMLERDLPPAEAGKEPPGLLQVLERPVALLGPGTLGSGAGTVAEQLGEFRADALRQSVEAAFDPGQGLADHAQTA